MQCKFTFCLGLFILLGSCNTRYYTPYEFEGAVLTVGTGGGFTGQVRSFTLLENGQLFTGIHSDQVDGFKLLPRRETRQIFNNYKLLKLDTLNIDKPGNMYHYIVYKQGDQEKKIQWGAYDANPPRELLIYFGNLKKIFNAHTNQKQNPKKEIR